MIRYLIAGLLGAIAGAAAGATVLPILAFNYALETMAIIMAGSGLKGPMFVVLIGAIVGAAMGLLLGVGMLTVVDVRDNRISSRIHQ